MRRPDRDASGAVTAELALVLPLLVAVTAGLVWLLAVGADQLRAVDAARETARALARGDTPEAAVAVGERVAPDGATVRVVTGEGRVHVTVTGEVAGPGGIFDALPPAQLHAEAVAVLEEGLA
jgi:Flp pilus assembly protein TadG